MKPINIQRVSGFEGNFINDAVMCFLKVDKAFAALFTASDEIDYNTFWGCTR